VGPIGYLAGNRQVARRISKRDFKRQNELILILAQDPISEKDAEITYQEFNESMLGDVGSGSAFSTGFDLAANFALMAGPSGVVVDVCAGIECLSFASRIRDYYHRRITKQITIEINPKYLEIGRKLCLFASWHLGSVFDKSIWNEIISKHGKIDCIISNPPFGSTSMRNVTY
jgi:tRNA1(Val) A37 N6-methylase TrmN6